MTDDLLQRIQELQFHDRSAAEALLLGFVQETFPQLDVRSVTLRPQAVSLNSFNGFLQLADDTSLFFKTHTESDNVIGEYYRAEMLAEAGYPVIQPLYKSTEAGKHLLIYDLVKEPSVFDVAWEIENGNDTYTQALASAQHAADDDLLRLYQATLSMQTTTEAASAPVHQLFHHRLTRGRLERFYGPLPGTMSADSTHTIDLPGGEVSMQEVRRVQWEINGQRYDETLDDIISRAINLLDPAQPGPAIVGHGDAHNGNVFFRGDNLLYFDPAFAGAHHPLLDMTKPLFHNVFAMWMYFPTEKKAQTAVLLQREGSRWIVSYDYALHSIRHMFFESKRQRVLLPMLKQLRDTGTLRDDWRAYLKAALFCCPFLTMNLADGNRFLPEISLLGLAMAVEMGAESSGQRSMIDAALDEVVKALDADART